VRRALDCKTWPQLRGGDYSYGEIKMVRAHLQRR
jgi:hypothetical protein